MKTLKLVAVGLGSVLILAACSRIRGIGFDDADSIDMSDTAGFDTGDDVGDAELVYALSDADGAIDCAEAGVMALDVTYDTLDGAATVTFPCDDHPIRLSGLPRGSVFFDLRGESRFGPVFAGSSEGRVTATAITVSVALACDPNGVGDSCGG